MQLVIQNQCKGPGNDCVALTTKLEVLSHASHHVLSVSIYYSINILAQLMTSHVVLNQQFIFCTFLRITSEPDEIE
jgi:hypothetical protein